MLAKVQGGAAVTSSFKRQALIAEHGSAYIRLWPPALTSGHMTGLPPKGLVFSSMAGGDNKFLCCGCRVTVLDQQDCGSFYPEADWPSLGHWVQLLR